MKIRNVILLAIIYSFFLGFINLNSIVASHEYYFIILPFLIDPILHFFSYAGWLTNITGGIWGILEFLILFPIFWPIVVTILIFIKNKVAPYVILISIYVFIITVASYRLIKEPEMLSNTINSLAIFVEPIGIILFIVGQVGIFYVLKLKRRGLLH